MITPAWCRMMAAYNAEMNRRFYAAAAGLEDQARRLDRGAFWGSIHGTLNHLLWADTMWMSRLDGWDRPPVNLRGSGGLIEDFALLREARRTADLRLTEWAGRVGQEVLEGDLSWYSGAIERNLTRPVAMVVAHMFNHQTHHRGQVHAMLTAAGTASGDTDLFLVVEGMEPG
ncbi:damage-inducible protein DinB [Roseomonas sp. OT10]|uniref:DinB family protein n=1 Tax=Roseomonas cutis TaxID=2897332 RepID=UPI001E361223|nr:DinB family protein [Roseomonas sp. OT10]UFN49529.1 damage-inducible protein DinB [Roseomonas sp. OT10]